MRALHAFIHATKPDSVVIIGDFMDFPQPSRWSKDTAAEFQGSVFRDSETGKRILADLRRGYDGPVKFIEGNHDSRPRIYLSKYAPALAESRAFHVDTLLDFDGHGVELVDPFYDIAPGWVATHGHIGIRTSPIPGATALKAVKRLGKSVVMGHVHRLGLMPDTTGTTASHAVRWAMEVGHIMDMKRAQYLGHVTANWQAGFGLLHVAGSHVRPEVIPLKSNGAFIAEGKVWS